ncbi:hypothetical protein [Microbulbifer sp. JMSA002]|uniref:hypothetical protein n=1 Tax=Microbulbifer sp. JMSA002 TaxID=3243368 RepID=UPI00403A4C1A
MDDLDPYVGNGVQYIVEKVDEYDSTVAIKDTDTDGRWWFPESCLELVTDEDEASLEPSPSPRKTLDDCSPEEWDEASRIVRGIEPTPTPESDAPSDTSSGAYVVQEGGSHYKKLAIQPMQYSMANGLDACQHTIVKYVTRHEDKAGIADLRKARHTLEILAQEKYGEAL